MNINICFRLFVIVLICTAFGVVVRDCNNNLHAGIDQWEQEMVESAKNTQRLKLEQQRLKYERENF